jgi:hypothetical protein
MTDLIDRYVHTVLRRVPEAQRTDIDRELRGAIDDAVDARLDGGASPEAAVEGALLELGDPRRLADGYADRPQYVIGPELYPIWRRLTLMLFSTVLPIVVAVSVVIRLLDHPAIGPVIGSAVGTALTTSVHLGFWSTLVFAVLERTGGGAGLRRPWTIADLPRYEPGAQTAGQLAATVVWAVLLIVALVLQQFTFSAVPLLDPANWSFWWPALIVVLVLEIGYAVWLYHRPAWSHTVTLVNAVLAVLFAAPAVWLLATHRFFNPEFLDRVGSGKSLDWLTTGTIAVIVLVAVWDIVDVALRTERSRRGRAAEATPSGSAAGRSSAAGEAAR